MQQQPVQQQQVPTAVWAPPVQQFPIHMPASMVPPHLITYNMSMPSHQGNVPALISSAGCDG
eukprot:2013417-Prorocentrum_lima.AAC.1